MWNFSKKDDCIAMENRVVVARGWGEEEWGDAGQRAQTFSYKKSKF